MNPNMNTAANAHSENPENLKLVKLNTQLNRRRSNREPIYAGDLPEVTVEIPSAHFSKIVQVRDLSTGGISIYDSDFTKEMVQQKINLNFNYSKKYSLHGRVVHFKISRIKGKDIPTLGIIFETPELTTPSQSFHRPKRFGCPKFFQAVAYGNHPHKFGQQIHFGIESFSAQGLTLKGMDARNLIFPGTILELNLLLPSIGEFKVKVQITNIRPIFVNNTHSDSFFAGGTFIDPTFEFLTGVSSYLLLAGSKGVTIKQLKESGFVTPKTEVAVKYSYVSSPEEWTEVLKLRLRAAQVAGRWIGETDETKLQDDFDQHARQIICKYEDKIVGSLRTVFNNGDIKRVEHQKYFSPPEWLWKDGFIEASRLCTDPDFRGSNIFMGLLQQAAILGVMSHCRYILCNCEDSLVPIYRRFGIKSIGVRFFTPFMQNKALNLGVGDIIKSCLGKGISLSYWYFFWPEVYYHLKNNGYYTPSLMDKFHFYTRLGLAKLLFIFINQKLMRKSLLDREQTLSKFKQDH